MLLIHNLSEVATPEGSTPRRGAEQGRVQRMRGAEVVCDDAGRISFVGPPEERLRLLGEMPEAERLDGRGGTLIPGFADPHTHLPWPGTREAEFAARLAGTTYQEIAAAGGGILSTVRTTRQARQDELRAIRRASAEHPVDLVPTLLAAHEVPLEYRQERERYLDLICEEIVPATAEQGLARFCDVFCERGVFSAEESRRVLEAGARYGL